MDGTSSSGAFCSGQAPCVLGCDGGSSGGGGGYYPTLHYDHIVTPGEAFPGYDNDFYAPERINAFGYILKNVYKHSPEFILDYTCQFGDLHFFHITDGIFNRNNWGVSDLGSQGWRANYRLAIAPFITQIRARTPGETLEWVTRIPIQLKLTPILGNPSEVVSTTFKQVGSIHGSFIGIHYR